MNTLEELDDELEDELEEQLDEQLDDEQELEQQELDEEPDRAYVAASGKYVVAYAISPKFHMREEKSVARMMSSSPFLTPL